MCKVGDIIVINNYKDFGKTISRHSFVVLSIESDQIQGLDYDLICNVMSSFKDEEQKIRKLKFAGNFPVDLNDQKMQLGHKTKDGFIKAEQFYYFNKSKLDYKIIGSMKDDVFEMLVNFIKDLDIEILQITDNL